MFKKYIIDDNISTVLNDPSKVTQIIQTGIRDALLKHKQAGVNAINCWHFSHSKNRHMKGINIVSCLVRYSDIALPVGYETVKKDVVYSDIATRKQKRTSQVSKNELFRSLIQQAVSNHILFDYVLADNWFGSKATMAFIHQDLKKHFIIGIKSLHGFKEARC